MHKTSTYVLMTSDWVVVLFVAVFRYSRLLTANWSAAAAANIIHSFENPVFPSVSVETARQQTGLGFRNQENGETFRSHIFEPLRIAKLRSLMSTDLLVL